MLEVTEVTEKTDQLQFRQRALVEQFQRFCRFLDGHLDALAAEPKSTDTTIEAVFDITVFSKHVAELTAEIAHTGQIISQRLPELANGSIRDFKYLLAAWADEAMIKTVGQDRLPMAQHGSVERNIFSTVHAGDEFFQKITNMLERRNADDLNLAAAYWLALMQGFEGRYIGGAGTMELRRYARALQAIALEKIDLPDPQKIQETESTQNPIGLFKRISQLIKSKHLFIFFTVLLLLSLTSLDMHWISSTDQLMRTLEPMSDLRQSGTTQ